MLIQSKLNMIDQLKKSVVDLVNSKPFFENLKVISDEKGDLDIEIEKKIISIGMSIVFECNEGRVSKPGMGSSAMDLMPTFTIEENVLINRNPDNPDASGKTATDVVCELFAVFNPMTATEPLPITLEKFETINNTGNVVRYQIIGKVQVGWKQVQ